MLKGKILFHSAIIDITIFFLYIIRNFFDDIKITGGKKYTTVSLLVRASYIN